MSVRDEWYSTRRLPPGPPPVPPTWQEVDRLRYEVDDLKHEVQDLQEEKRVIREAADIKLNRLREINDFLKQQAEVQVEDYKRSIKGDLRDAAAQVAEYKQQAAETRLQAAIDLEEARRQLAEAKRQAQTATQRAHAQSKDDQRGARLAETQQQLEEAKRQLADAQQQLEQAKQQAADAQQLASAAQARADKQLKTKQSAMDGMGRMLQQAQQEARTSAALAAQQVAEVQKQFQEAQAELGSSRAEVERLKGSLKEQQDANSDMQRKLASESSAVAAERARADQLSLLIGSMGTAAETWSRAEAELRARLDKAERDVQVERGKAQAAIQEVAALKSMFPWSHAPSLLAPPADPATATPVPEAPALAKLPSATILTDVSIPSSAALVQPKPAADDSKAFGTRFSPHEAVTKPHMHAASTANANPAAKRTTSIFDRLVGTRRCKGEPDMGSSKPEPGPDTSLPAGTGRPAVLSSIKPPLEEEEADDSPVLRFRLKHPSTAAKAATNALAAAASTVIAGTQTNSMGPLQQPSSKPSTAAGAVDEAMIGTAAPRQDRVGRVMGPLAPVLAEPAPLPGAHLANHVLQGETYGPKATINPDGTCSLCNSRHGGACWVEHPHMAPPHRQHKFQTMHANHCIATAKALSSQLSRAYANRPQPAAVVAPVSGAAATQDSDYKAYLERRAKREPSPGVACKLCKRVHEGDCWVKCPDQAPPHLRAKFVTVHAQMLWKQTAPPDILGKLDGRDSSRSPSPARNRVRSRTRSRSRSRGRTRRGRKVSRSSSSSRSRSRDRGKDTTESRRHKRKHSGSRKSSGRR